MNRLRAMGEYEEACKTTIKRKLAAEKLKLSAQIKHDKVDAALVELDEAKTAEEEAQKMVKKMSEDIKDLEWPTMHCRRHADFVEQLNEFVRGQVDLEKRQMREWQGIVSDIKSIHSVGASHHLAEKIAAQVL